MREKSRHAKVKSLNPFFIRSRFKLGDADAFTVTADLLDGIAATALIDVEGFDGVIVIHPAAALRLASRFVIGVFENAHRAAEGEKPVFCAKALHLYDLRD